jgi:Domain of unknown function (DUF4326)
VPASKRPVRIQLHRTKGWRKPEGVVVVARPSKWGNPYVVGVDGTRTECVELYRGAMERGQLPFTGADVRRELAGRDLACWCRLDEVCHGDLLLEMANAPPTRSGPAVHREG